MSTDPRVAAFALVLRRTREFRADFMRPASGSRAIWLCYARLRAHSVLTSKAWKALADAHYAASQTHHADPRPTRGRAAVFDDAERRAMGASFESSEWEDQAEGYRQLADRIAEQRKEIRIQREIRAAVREQEATR